MIAMSHFTRAIILDKHSNEDIMPLTFQESMLRLLDICTSIIKTHSKTKKQVRLINIVVLIFSIVVGWICFVAARDSVLPLFIAQPGPAWNPFWPKAVGLYLTCLPHRNIDFRITTSPFALRFEKHTQGDGYVVVFEEVCHTQLCWTLAYSGNIVACVAFTGNTFKYVGVSSSTSWAAWRIGRLLIILVISRSFST